MLLFKRHLVELVRQGKKRQTIRLWTKSMLKPGQISYTPGLGKMLITQVDELPSLKALTEADARADGFANLQGLLAEIHKIYGREIPKNRLILRIAFQWPVEEPPGTAKSTGQTTIALRGNARPPENIALRGNARPPENIALRGNARPPETIALRGNARPPENIALRGNARPPETIALRGNARPPENIALRGNARPPTPHQRQAETKLKTAPVKPSRPTRPKKTRKKNQMTAAHKQKLRSFILSKAPRS